MNTVNHTEFVAENNANHTIVVEKDAECTSFSLKNTTGKLVIALISDSSQVLNKTSYTIDMSPVLLEGSLTDYDVDSFSAIIQEYIVYLQHNEEQDRSFRLMIERKPKIDNSFYEKVGLALKNYADKITIKSGNNMMILNCD